MQASKILLAGLVQLADADHYLFGIRDLAALVPDSSASAIKTLISRLVARGELERVCRGVFLYPRVPYPGGLVLYHCAALLRADSFCYLSLESVLSDAGVISQVPMQRITVMTSGRRQEVDCGKFGVIEFIHTAQRPGGVAERLTFDPAIRMWRADVRLAMRDMRRTGRNLDLIEQEMQDELI